MRLGGNDTHEHIYLLIHPHKQINTYLSCKWNQTELQTFLGFTIDSHGLNSGRGTTFLSIVVFGSCMEMTKILKSTKMDS
jgi:hypothetical protein